MSRELVGEAACRAAWALEQASAAERAADVALDRAREARVAAEIVLRAIASACDEVAR